MTPLQSAVAVIQSLSDPIFLVGEDERLAGANDAAAELTGHTAATLTGTNFADIVDATPLEIEQKLATWRRSRSPLPGTLSFRTPGGSVKLPCEGAAAVFGDSELSRVVLLRCRERLETNQRFSALENQIQALGREIRERERTEQALGDSERRFRALFENASDSIIIADDSGMIVDANPAACELVGRGMDELAHLRVIDLSPEVAHDETRGRWSEFIESGTQRGFFTVVRPDGDLREVEYNAVRNFIAGRHLSVLRDVTEQRRAAVERDRQTEALARSNAEIEQFAYVASHDLQEPLRTISSFLQLTERRLGSDLDAEAATYMSTVRGAVHRLKRILLDLLEFSRLGRIEHRRVQVDLDGILDDVVRVLRAEVEATGAVIAMGQLPTVAGDPDQLHQLFLNVLANALKFRSTNPAIEVTAERRGEEWVIQVRDNGPGIESRYFGRIFEPFRRLHGYEIPGSGIGLAISRRVLENHGGRIWVESEPGAGSTFYIALPVMPPPQVPPRYSVPFTRPGPS